MPKTANPRNAVSKQKRKSKPHKEDSIWYLKRKTKRSGSLLFNLTSDFISLYDEFSVCENYGYVLKYADESKVNNPDYNRVCSVETPAPDTKMPYVTVNYGYSLPSSLNSGSVYSFQKRRQSVVHERTQRYER